MSPAWKRIAEELRATAADRALAASNEPDPTEARLLERESVLLARAAMLAGAGLADHNLGPYADAGVVLNADDLVMWGVSGAGEASLRRLAQDPTVDVQQVDPARVLSIVMGADAGRPPA